MHVRFFAIAPVLFVWAGACARPGNPLARIVARHGPVIESELIVGRAEEFSDGHGPAVLLTSGNALILIDPWSGHAERQPIAPLPANTILWGLARLDDGEMWTLEGRNTLLQVTADGHPVTRVALSGPHIGVFGQGRQILLQPLSFLPPGDALMATVPGEAARAPWGGLRTRTLPLARAAVAVMNLVTCGTGLAPERPCWFPNETTVAMIDRAGRARRLDLPGLSRVSAQMLLTSDNPPRPIRDAYATAAGTLWILTSGTPPAGAAQIPGGWALMRYGRDGRLIAHASLPESARVILRATEDRCIVLSGRGEVLEVGL